jgi:sugar-specific transcriptional regulator TrmB
MQINKYKNALTEFGLKENEVIVYLTALSLGPTTILKIATETHIRRTTIYEIIKSLTKKGLMSTELKGFKKLFCAMHPQNLVSIFENKKEKLQGIVPELTTFYKTGGNESAIKTYEGIESIISLYREILDSYRSGDFCYVIGDTDRFLAQDPFFTKYVEKRAQMNVDTKIIMPDSPAARERKKYERNYNSTIKIIPPGTDLPANFTITKNIFLTQGLVSDPVAITTTNKDIINLQKNLFNIIWNSLQE